MLFPCALTFFIVLLRGIDSRLYQGTQPCNSGDCLKNSICLGTLYYPSATFFKNGTQIYPADTYVFLDGSIFYDKGGDSSLYENTSYFEPGSLRQGRITWTYSDDPVEEFPDDPNY